MQPRARAVQLYCTACVDSAFHLPWDGKMSIVAYLFVLYTADVLQLVRDHDLIPHAFADDTQILGTCCPSDIEAMQNLVSHCLDDVSSWMSANRLQLNHSKTEALWCSSS